MSAKKINELKEVAKQAPVEPGVYFMKNAEGKILYVGKAKNIRNRVRTYFNKLTGQSKKTKYLVKNIDHISFMTTKTEAEAFLLEASMIKKHRPKFNIRLKDDKAYPYIKVSMSHAFPRLYLSRKVKNDGSYYFGPFTSSLSVRETIRFLNQTFRIRDCRDHFMKNRKRACMTYQIGRCTAPCVDFISEEDYKKDIRSAIQFLKGKKKSLLQDLTKKMKEAASEERFEAAARYRDSIKALEHILEKQSVINANSRKDQDVVAIYGEEGGTCFEVLSIRQGRMIGRQAHFFPLLDSLDPEEDIRESVTSFLMQYYEDNLIPDELITPIELGNDLNVLLEKLLRERRGQEKVVVRFPTEDYGQELLRMARQNAKQSFKQHIKKKDERKKALEEIQRKFSLPKLPERIECYDISTFQGKESVASQVVFVNGEPAKEHYRRYKIKTVEGANDFASMKEVLSRRLKHSEYDEPDLIVVDGGKGQLRMATEVLKELDMSRIPVVGLAKARTQRDFQDDVVESSQERFFLPGRENAVTFLSNSTAQQILTSLRDEAHRFAITYHRKLRDRQSLSSELDFVRGLGVQRKKTLLREYKSVEAIRNASAEDIAKLRGFTAKLAIRILDQLNRPEENLEEETENEKP